MTSLLFEECRQCHTNELLLKDSKICPNCALRNIKSKCVGCSKEDLVTSSGLCSNCFKQKFGTNCKNCHDNKSLDKDKLCISCRINMLHN